MESLTCNSSLKSTEHKWSNKNPRMQKDYSHTFMTQHNFMDNKFVQIFRGDQNLFIFMKA